MALLAFAARFAVLPAKDAVLSRLREELGGEQTDEIDIDWRFASPQKPEAAYRGEVATAAILFSSFDPISLIYAKKVCIALGGHAMNVASGALTSDDVPPWTKSPWTHHNPLERLRIRLTKPTF